MLSTNWLEIEVRDHVGWLTLNRPHVGNAIDSSLLFAFKKALSEVEGRKDLRCLVLAGAGRHFCSGVDLRSLQISGTERQDTREPMSRSFLDHIIQRLLDLRMPIVAAVSGAAAGTGMTLAMSADIVLMAEDAYFLPSFAKLGLVPDNGITCLLSERIGASRARAALMLGQRIDARMAFEWGLAYQVVAPDALHATAGEFAERLAAGPRRVLAATRRLLNEPEIRNLRKQLKAERSAHQDALTEGEHLEGVSAFFSGREPEFHKV